MPTELRKRLNLADYFLDARVRDGRGARIALLTDHGPSSYAEVAERAARFGRLLEARGVQPEQRVMIALPDGPDFVAAFFGTLKLGAVVVMVNPSLPEAEIAALLDYTRARAVVTHRDSAGTFEAAARGADLLRALVVTGTEDFEHEWSGTDASLETFPTHPDDAAIWLFSGGTTGTPKAVLQTHHSFVNTTECYARHVIGYREDDVTMSVPKLYFGYATGSNLLFPFSAGAASALFPEACTAEVLFDRIRKIRPTVLINVPTMINRMVSHPNAARGSIVGARLHLGGRGAAGRAARAMEERVRRSAAGWARNRRDVAHLHLQPVGRRASRHARRHGPWLRGARLRRCRASGAPQRDRLAVGARRFARARLLAARREVRAGVSRRVVRLGGSHLDGRRRRDHVLRAR
jgi:acyl-CoA synthetase (AMP-forming)/AMP-acid ligase II